MIKERLVESYEERKREREQDKTIAANRRESDRRKFEACKSRYVIHLVIISLTCDVYECYRGFT